MFRLTPSLAALCLCGIAIGFAVSDLWRSWWNLTLFIPAAALIWWLHHQQAR